MIKLFKLTEEVVIAPSAITGYYKTTSYKTLSGKWYQKAKWEQFYSICIDFDESITGYPRHTVQDLLNSEADIYLERLHELCKGYLTSYDDKAKP